MIWFVRRGEAESRSYQSIHDVAYFIVRAYNKERGPRYMYTKHISNLGEDISNAEGNGPLSECYLIHGTLRS